MAIQATRTLNNGFVLNLDVTQNDQKESSSILMPGVIVTQIMKDSNNRTVKGPDGKAVKEDVELSIGRRSFGRVFDMASALSAVPEPAKSVSMAAIYAQFLGDYPELAKSLAGAEVQPAEFFSSVTELFNEYDSEGSATTADPVTQLGNLVCSQVSILHAEDYKTALLAFVEAQDASFWAKVTAHVDGKRANGVNDDGTLKLRGPKKTTK